MSGIMTAAALASLLVYLPRSSQRAPFSLAVAEPD